ERFHASDELVEAVDRQPDVTLDLVEEVGEASTLNKKVIKHHKKVTQLCSDFESSTTNSTESLDQPNQKTSDFLNDVPNNVENGEDTSESALQFIGSFVPYF